MQKFRTDYEELFLSGRNTDFTIHVKDVKFEVHRSILGARSPVFSAMMEHNMVEKRSGEVTLIDADPAVFRLFLLYLYSGDEQHMDGKNITELYKLGDKYCVEDLRYLCVERMMTHLSIENFCDVFHISQQIQNSELSESVIQFFFEDLKEIIRSEKYVEFRKAHPEETRVLAKALKAKK